ncbi:MAG: insulinase family protein, partial [Gammaproteobacteria bacterium]|nr:insulinase family protein [Gammaproteobacteria bacterium]
DELESSVKNITGGFPLRIDSNKKVVEYLAMIGFYHLPLDYLHNFNRRIEAVTLDGIKSALQRRLNPEKMITVIVGGETKNSQTKAN